RTRVFSSNECLNKDLANGGLIPEHNEGCPCNETFIGNGSDLLPWNLGDLKSKHKTTVNSDAKNEAQKQRDFV
ncbi:hypothetical protein PMAYCL1PPCAC_27113, partial [Pristionchus mayeri]